MMVKESCRTTLATTDVRHRRAATRFSSNSTGRYPMSAADTPRNPLSEAAFVQLLSKHQRHLHSFIRSLVPTHADADDVMQDTSLALWEKRQHYDPERDFFSWACGVAHIQVLRHRRKTATERLWFNDDVLDLLASQMIDEAKLFEFRRDALYKCVDRLPDSDRKVVELRYQDGMTLDVMSRELGSSARSIQRTMARARRVLHRCISATLREWHVQ